MKFCLLDLAFAFLEVRKRLDCGFKKGEWTRVELLINLIRPFLKITIIHWCSSIICYSKNPETQQLSKYTVRGKMLSRALGILHNLSKCVPTRRSFAACQAIDVLIPLLKAEVTLFSAKSLLVLAYLTDEENNHLIMADEGNIYTQSFFMQIRNWL